mgnify:CR=1 FL=1
MILITVKGTYELRFDPIGIFISKKSDRLDTSYEPSKVVMDSIEAGEEFRGDTVIFHGTGSSLELWFEGKKVLWTSTVVDIDEE